MTNFIIIVFLTLILFQISYQLGLKFKLLDKPSDRKIHKIPTPYTGGLGLILTYFLVVKLLFFELIVLQIIFTSFFIFIIGFLDDKYNINISTRLLFQIFIIYFFINNNNLEINYIFNLNEKFELSLGGFNIIFTVLCVALFLNSCNYIDGIDGLLTLQTIFIFSSIIFLQLFFYKTFNLELFFLIIPLIIFLLVNFNIFNFPKLFLGNGGSAMLGFIISFIIIYYSYYDDLNIDGELIIWSVSFIVYEFISTTISRILRKKPIFNSGHDHIHYILKNKFNSILSVNLTIFILNILFILTGFFAWLHSDILSVVIFVFLFFVYFIIREKLLKIYFTDI